MMKKENFKEFLKPMKKLMFFVLIFLGIEFILWLMTLTCAIACPKPPTPCKSYCLLNKNEFLPASIINLIFSYLITSFVQPERKSFLSLLFIVGGVVSFVFVFGFFIVPFLR